MNVLRVFCEVFVFRMSVRAFAAASVLWWTAIGVPLLQAQTVAPPSFNADVNAVSKANFKTTLYKTKDGLSANATKALVQDLNNIVWIGLDEGLTRFDGTQFRNFRNNLPSRYVKFLLRTRDNRLLAGHDLGISEIRETPDTITFPLLLRGERTETDSTVNYPKQLFEDTDGSLWIAESKSIVHYSVRVQNGVKTVSFKRHPFPVRCQTNSFLRSFSFVEDGLGSFLVCSQTGYCFWYNRQAGSFDELLLPQNNAPLDAASDMLNVSKGCVWIAYADGIMELRIDAAGKLLAAPERRITLPGASVLHRGPNGAVFIGTWFSGLFILEASKNAPPQSPLQSPLEPQRCSLPFLSVNVVKTNPNGDVWVSSDEGIALLKPSPVLTTVFGSETRGYIQAIARDDAGRMYTSDGIAAYRLTKQPSGQTTTEEILRIKGTDILAMAHNGVALWCGTVDGRLYRASAESFTSSSKPRFEIIPTITQDGRSPTLFYLFADHSANVWACAELGAGALKITDNVGVNNPPNSASQQVSRQGTPTVELYNAVKGLPSVIRCFAQSPQNVLYAAGRSRNQMQYLFRYLAATDRFQDVSKPLPADALRDFEVNDICVRADDDVWLCSSVGLFHYTAAGVVKVPIFYAPTGEEIINMKAIQADAEGVLWIGTSHGVVVYFGNDEYFFLNENGGLPANEVAFRAMFGRRGQSGMWVGTAKGLVNIPSLASIPPNTPTPLLTFLRINGRKESLEELLKQQHNGRERVFPHGVDIQLGFLSVVFGEEAVSYQYRLLGEGRDTVWSPPQQESGTTFLTLPTGAYRLQVRAIQSGAYRWSVPLMFPFAVQSAWYEHWWSQVGLGLVAIAVVWVVVKLNRRRLEQQKAELQNLINNRTEEIQKKNVEITLSRERLETMSEIGRDLTASLSFEVIASALYDNVSSVLPVERFAIGILHATEKTIEYRFIIERGQRLTREEIRLEEADCFATWSMAHLRAVVLNDPSKDAEKYLTGLVPHNAKLLEASSLYAPLVLQERAFGILQVQTFHLHAYAPDHLDILQTLANYAAIAIANAESNEKILHQQETLAAQTEELHEQNERLLHLNTEKNEFLGIVAHDLKNPISGIRGMAELLLESGTQFDVNTHKQVLETIVSSSERMLKLVTNLLNVNQIERGAMSPVIIKLDVAPLVAFVMEIYHEQATAKDIRLHLNIEGTTTVLADEQATMQVLDNLISNAIKYSPTGKNVFVRMKSEGGNMNQKELSISSLSPLGVALSPSDFLRIEVADEGPGISPEDMKKLFGKFARLSAQPTGGEHSTGLGLSIVKKVVEAMNGRVWCESELGKGAAFIVELPLADEPEGIYNA